MNRHERGLPRQPLKTGAAAGMENRFRRGLSWSPVPGSEWMKKRLLLAAVIVLAWLAFFSWQKRGIDDLTTDVAPAASAP